jgi:LmbE family N-acetylglucosaminyl deacetylase
MARAKPFSGPGDRRLKRALCIVAHPDDIEFFCGGTVLLLSDRGAVVDFVLVTSGDKGTRDAALTSADLMALREEEQRRAAAVLGAREVRFLRQPDAEVVDTLELRGALVREIRHSQPDVLLTFDPTPGYRQHPDHRVVGRVALDAAWPCARDRLSFPTPDLPAHETAEAWCFSGPDPDLVIDVSSVLERKISARLEHRSQTRWPPALRSRWRRTANPERFKQVDLR